MQDVTLTCINPKCPHGTFTWSVGEQKFMQKLLENGKIDEIAEPKRCPDCRKKRKEHLARKNSQ